MPAITIPDLNRAKQDVDHIAEVATSTALTATDRLGNVKPTVKGAVNTLAAFNGRGAFAGATAYALKDVYTSAGIAYVAVIAHVSTSVAADLAAGKVTIHQGATREDLAAPGGAGLLGWLRAAVGAVFRWASDKFSDHYNAFDHFTAAEKADALTGAPATDTTAKIQAAIDGAFLAGQKLVGYGTFRIGADKLVFKGDADFSQAIFNVYGAPAIAVEISTGSSANSTTNLGHKVVRLGAIINMAKPATGWAGQGIGVRLVNLLHCDTHIKHIKGFDIGKLETSFQAGHAYNEATVLYYESNRVNIKLQPGDAVAWVNENNYYGGRYHINSTVEGSNVAGTRHIQILPFDLTNSVTSWPNQNIFHKPSIEGNTPEYHVEIAGTDNAILHGRWEVFGGLFPKVLFRGHPSNVSKCARNLISGGYETDRIVFSTSGAGLWGDLVHTRKKTSSGFGLGHAMRHTGGDVETTPLIRGFKSDKEINAAITADTDWQFNLFARGLQGKVSTDAFSRLHLDWWTGRMYFGAGVAAPTKYIIGNGSYLYCSIDFVPTSDNAFGLGSGAARWSTVYAGTGTINTSDEREKQQIEPIDAAAMRAVRKVDFRQFKFNDSVAAKGTSARWHFGVVAQQVQSAFESEGLNAFEYGLLCYDEWAAQPEERNEDGKVTHEFRPAGSRYGVRYEELLCLRMAATVSPRAL